MSTPREMPSVVHIRRCHVCGSVNESVGAAVHKCSSCGKHLAPFYYFDESKLEGLEEKGPFLSEWSVGPWGPYHPSGQFHPIWGLSTYWQESYEGHDRRHQEGS